MISPTGTGAGGLPLYERNFASGFRLVIEGRRGGTNAEIDFSTFKNNPLDPTAVPGVLVFLSRPIGDGSVKVCDDSFPDLGGVPSIDPPDLSDAPEVINALNDIGCRFKDGVGNRSGRKPEDACTVSADGDFRPVKSNSTVQFCGPISEVLRFPSGDTVVTVRIRDVAGNVSAASQIIIRVVGE